MVANKSLAAAQLSLKILDEFPVFMDKLIADPSSHHLAILHYREKESEFDTERDYILDGESRPLFCIRASAFQRLQHKHRWLTLCL
jgi:hypothetical protein